MEDEIPPDQPGPLAAAAEMEDREMERHLRLTGFLLQGGLEEN